MKKIMNSFFCFLFTCAALFWCAGCEFVGKKLSTSGEGTNVFCAPCTAYEIWQWNEAVYQEFFPVRRVVVYNNDLIKCSVNGRNLSTKEQMEQELSTGIYKIRFYTLEGTILSKQTMEEYMGNYVVGWEEIPFEADITIWVTISTLYEDVCDVNYRQKNGLWVDASELAWYEDCKAEWW